MAQQPPTTLPTCADVVAYLSQRIAAGRLERTALAETVAREESVEPGRWTEILERLDGDLDTLAAALVVLERDLDEVDR